MVSPPPPPPVQPPTLRGVWTYEEWLAKDQQAKLENRLWEANGRKQAEDGDRVQDPITGDYYVFLNDKKIGQWHLVYRPVEVSFVKQKQAELEARIAAAFPNPKDGDLYFDPETRAAYQFYFGTWHNALPKLTIWVDRMTHDGFTIDEETLEWIKFFFELGLDIAGLFPGTETIADLIAVLYYAAQGETLDALISLIGLAIPLVGAVYIRQIAKAVGKLSDLLRLPEILPYLRPILEKFAEVKRKADGYLQGVNDWIRDNVIRVLQEIENMLNEALGLPKLQPVTPTISQRIEPPRTQPELPKTPNKPKTTVNTPDRSKVDLEKIPSINGQRPRNWEFANQKYRTESGYDVWFDEHGFPIFDEFSAKSVQIKMQGNRTTDFAQANVEAGFVESVTEPGAKDAHLKFFSDYTWHHHQDTKTMQLVPKKVHNSELGGVSHTGGVSILKNNQDFSIQFSFPSP